MKPRTVRRLLDIYLTAEENPGKPQLRDHLKAVRTVLATNDDRISQHVRERQGKKKGKDHSRRYRVTEEEDARRLKGYFYPDNYSESLFILRNLVEKERNCVLHRRNSVYETLVKLLASKLTQFYNCITS